MLPRFFRDGPAKHCLVAISALAFTQACSAQADIARPSKTSDGLDICAYELVHSDEFDNLDLGHRTLDGAKWTVHTPWNGDFGDAAFSDPRPDGRPFAVRDGILHITAYKDDGEWRSGLLAAADASGAGWGVQYGYFEARMRMPPGPGTWPAFWLISLQPVETRAPRIEIDVVEYYGHDDSAYQVASHVWYKRPSRKRNRHTGEEVPVPAGSLVAEFHDYGVRIDPEWTTYYLDRKPVWKLPTPSELKTPLYPLVNLALGSGYSIEDTPDPSVLLIDHVRVYRPDPEGRKRRCPD